MSKGQLHARFCGILVFGVMRESLVDEAIRFFKVVCKTITPVKGPQKRIQKSGFPETILRMNQSDIALSKIGEDDFLPIFKLPEVVQDNAF